MKDHPTYTNRIGLTLVLLMFCFLPHYACARNYNAPKVSLSACLPARQEAENRLCIKTDKRWCHDFFAGTSNSLHKDSIKVKYALNDPRNPDCPCHKYQQLADEEYKKLQTQGIAFQSIEKQHKSQRTTANFPPDLNSRTDGSRAKGFASENKIHKKHNAALTRHKRHRKNRRSNTWKRVFGIRNWDVWKRIADPAACYKWG